MDDKFKGKFIVLDGPDGCGKSTQVSMLTDWLKSSGAVVETCRDPGATVVGEKIREILLDPAHRTIGVNTEVLLYMAARTQLWKEKIAPALLAGKCVLMDRWVSSTCAYQGCAGGFGVGKVVALASDCLERLWPDLTIILDVDIETASARMTRQLDRMEQKGSAYHTKVREGFLELAKKYSHVVVVDGGAEPDKVHSDIIEALEQIL